MDDGRPACIKPLTGQIFHRPGTKIQTPANAAGVDHTWLELINRENPPWIPRPRLGGIGPVESTGDSDYPGNNPERHSGRRHRATFPAQNRRHRSPPSADPPITDAIPSIVPACLSRAQLLFLKINACRAEKRASRPYNSLPPRLGRFADLLNTRAFLSHLRNRSFMTNANPRSIQTNGYV
jgi:hypothetical protein